MEETSIFLTQSDVDHLLQDHSADSRIDVMEKIADQYSNRDFQPSEYVVAQQIFRLLMRDTEVRVRETLARNVVDMPNIPRDVILHLARDVASVSVPLLQASDMLSDAELIDIAESSREITKLMAISKRDRVSMRVSDALIGTHYPQVVTSLLKNEGAEISNDGYSTILTEFSDEQTVTAAMSERPKLPLVVVERLVNHVTESVARELRDRYNFDTKKIEQHTMQAREEVTLDLVNEQTDDRAMGALVGQMQSSGRLSPSIVLAALCRGQLGFFEQALAELADIPIFNARKLIHDRGPLGFHALYGKTGLPESMFDAVRLVLNVALDLRGTGEIPGSPGYSNHMVERILAYAGESDIENLPYILALIRQQTGRSLVHQ